jgi:hypothetical protein
MQRHKDAPNPQDGQRIANPFHAVGHDQAKHIPRFGPGLQQFLSAVPDGFIQLKVIPAFRTLNKRRAIRGLHRLSMKTFFNPQTLLSLLERKLHGACMNAKNISNIFQSFRERIHSILPLLYYKSAGFSCRNADGSAHRGTRKNIVRTAC